MVVGRGGAGSSRRPLTRQPGLWRLCRERAGSTRRSSRQARFAGSVASTKRPGHGVVAQAGASQGGGATVLERGDSDGPGVASHAAIRHSPQLRPTCQDMRRASARGALLLPRAAYGTLPPR